MLNKNLITQCFRINIDVYDREVRINVPQFPTPICEIIQECYLYEKKTLNVL